MACCESQFRTDGIDTSRGEQRCQSTQCSQQDVSGKLRRLIAATDYTGPELIGGSKWSELSINARKKLIKLSKIKELRKKRKVIRRQTEKKDRDTQDIETSERLSKYDLKQIQRQKLSEAMENGLKVAVDCSFEETLSSKEICKLSGQIGRLYGSNKKAEQPFHLYLLGLKSSGRLLQECRRRHTGFDSFIVERTEGSAWDITDKKNIVFLTPDSKNVLKDLEPSKMYVLGGLVDESIAKNLTAKFSADNDLYTARLPIVEYLEKEPGSVAHTVLTINQVVDILLCFQSTGDWGRSLVAHVPRRKGYRLKSAE